MSKSERKRNEFSVLKTSKKRTLIYSFVHIKKYHRFIAVSTSFLVVKVAFPAKRKKHHSLICPKVRQLIAFFTRDFSFEEFLMGI